MARPALLLSWLLVAICFATLSACSFFPINKPVDPVVERQLTGPDPAAPRLPPLLSTHFTGVSADDEILGDMQVLCAHYENTFAGLARRYNLSYDEMRAANPGIDSWLPGEGTPIYLPTMAVVPEGPRDGIVINLPGMRLLYYVAERPDDIVNSLYSVTSHPIGIGREDWATPLGTSHITEKAREPNWYPPDSVRADHAELGDPLPRVVGPGPDNPLGHFKMRLSIPGYLIHGTNKPSGVGMRVSHGCIRLYPEDIEGLFELVPSRTPVYIVDQPVLAGWHRGELYFEVHPSLAEDKRDLAAEAERVIAAALIRAGARDAQLDTEGIRRVVAEQRGIPFPVLGRDRELDEYLYASRIINNTATQNSDASTASR